MFKVNRVMLFIIGFLFHSVAQADDSSSQDWSPSLSTTLNESLPLPEYEPTSSTQSLSPGLDKLHFQDSSTVGRASKLRSLSLLTLAQFKKSRLFLGVNSRGVLGLHFNAAKHGDDRSLEVARMPYLRNQVPD